MAGTRFGSTIRRKTVNRPAPSEAAASSISRSSSRSVGWTVRTTNGSVTNPSHRVPAHGGSGARARRGRDGAATATALLAKPRLDLGHDSRLGIEEALLHLRPAAELLDREEPRPDRVVVLLHDAAQH